MNSGKSNIGFQLSACKHRACTSRAPAGTQPGTSRAQPGIRRAQPGTSRASAGPIRTPAGRQPGTRRAQPGIRRAPAGHAPGPAGLSQYPPSHLALKRFLCTTLPNGVVCKILSTWKATFVLKINVAFWLHDLHFFENGDTFCLQNLHSKTHSF